MRLYIVRHGLTVGNKGQIIQDAHDPLSEEGQAQARFVAEKLKQFPLDSIVTSSFSRAKETAEIINSVLGKELIITDLAREVPYPTVVHGKPHAHPDAVAIKELVKQNLHDPDWKHSDEESFNDLCQRVDDFMALVTATGHENVLVITHGNFLKQIVAHLLLGELLNPALLHRIRQNFLSKNTGITIIEQRDDHWALVTWNDYAHLNEL